MKSYISLGGAIFYSLSLCKNTSLGKYAQYTHPGSLKVDIVNSFKTPLQKRKSQFKENCKDKKEIKLWYYIEIKRKDNGERMNGEYTYRKE